MRRRRYRDRSLRPVVSVFLLGLFFLLGLSPGSIMFDVLLDAFGQYVQYAALIALVVMVYFVYDGVYTPLKHMSDAYRSGQALGIIAMVLAFLAGVFIFVDLKGIALLLASVILWKIAIR